LSIAVTGLTIIKEKQPLNDLMKPINVQQKQIGKLSDRTNKLK